MASINDRSKIICLLKSKYNIIITPKSVNFKTNVAWRRVQKVNIVLV